MDTLTELQDIKSNLLITLGKINNLITNITASGSDTPQPENSGDSGNGGDTPPTPPSVG